MEIAPSSAWGPSWEGLNKPDVTAIGAVISSGNYYNEGNRLEVIESYDAYGVPALETWAGQYGTSQASPMVAGIIALWLQAKPTLTPEDIMAVIRKTAKPLEAVPNNKSGAGLIDAYAGLLEILGLVEGLPAVQADTDRMYYDLLGRPVGTNPAAQGVYVTKGKKVLIQK
jgi:subtilisin family serine protease